ncbi:MAG: DUF3990 domain-containing protein [Gemmataceae bacterium]
MAPPILNPPPAWKSFSSHVELYHGCVLSAARSIHRHGVDPTRGDPRTDFGRGFYATTLRRQARDWAVKRHLELPPAARPSDPPVVLRFRLPLDRLAPLHSLAFVRGDYHDDRFWSLVHHCRRSPRPPSAPHDHLYTGSARRTGWYDVVVGPVAAFWQQRVAMTGADQISFHTRRAARRLTRLIRSGDPAQFRVIRVRLPKGAGP